MKKKAKIFSVIIIAIFVCLVVIYNLGTSQYCIKNYILPMIAEKTNSEISAADIEVSLIRSSVMINDLKYSSSGLAMHSEKLILKTSIYDLLFNHKINIHKFLLKNTNLTLDLSPKNAAIIPVEKEKIKQTAMIHGEKKKEYQNKSGSADEKSSKKNTLYKISLNNISLDNLNVLLKNNDTITEFDNLNLHIPNIEPEKECTINLDGKISLTDGKKLVEGFVRSKSIVTVNNEFVPTDINSDSLIKLNNNKIPLVVRLNTNEDKTFEFVLKTSDIILNPFVSAFITGPYSNTEGKINNVSVKASGQDINDLVSGSSPINSTVIISGINISSQNHFYMKNKSIEATFDLSSIIKNKLSLDSIIINELNAEYIDNSQSVKVQDLNLKVNKDSKNKMKSIINTDFVYNKGNKILQGTIAGRIQLTGEDISKPESIESTIDLQLNGHSTPIVVKYENNSATEKVLVNLKHFDISPFKDFLDTDSSDLTGDISDINITLSGKGINALKKGFRKDSTSSIMSDLTMKSVNIKNNGKYSVVIHNLYTNFDLNKILNKKYYVNSLRVDEPRVVIIKKTKPETANNASFSDNLSSASKTNSIDNQNPVIAKKTKSETTGNTSFSDDTSSISKIKMAIPATTDTKHKNYDFDIRNIYIDNLSAKIISDKTLVFSNVNINSKGIKANTSSKAEVRLNYAIDDKLKGTLNAENDFIIASNLLPETFRSIADVVNYNNKSYLDLNFNCKQISQNNIPFSLNAKVNNLLLDPFLMTFAPIPYNKMSTNVDTLTLDVKGQDLYKFKTMDGSITSKLTNISVPINIKDKNLIEVLFFPLRVLADLSSNTALKFVPGTITNSINKIDDMFNNKKRIDFKKGKLNISLNSGLIIIKEFDFHGVPQNPITEMRVAGSINLNNNAVNLNTNTVLANLIIPLVIRGTIQKPKTDTARIIAAILQKNSETLVNTGVDMTKTINETINNIKNKNFADLLQTPTTGKNTAEKTEPKPEQTSQQKKIGDAVNNILDILGKNTKNSSSNNQQQQKNSNETNKETSKKINKVINDFLNF